MWRLGPWFLCCAVLVACDLSAKHNGFGIEIPDGLPDVDSLHVQIHLGGCDDPKGDPVYVTRFQTDEGSAEETPTGLAAGDYAIRVEGLSSDCVTVASDCLDVTFPSDDDLVVVLEPHQGETSVSGACLAWLHPDGREAGADTDSSPITDSGSGDSAD